MMMMIPRFLPFRFVFITSYHFTVQHRHAVPTAREETESSESSRMHVTRTADIKTLQLSTKPAMLPTSVVYKLNLV